jgi:hypothetical protein
MMTALPVSGPGSGPLGRHAASIRHARERRLGLERRAGGYRVPEIDEYAWMRGR